MLKEREGDSLLSLSRLRIVMPAFTLIFAVAAAAALFIGSDRLLVVADGE